MHLYFLINDLLTDTYASLSAFLPELTLCGTIVLMLLVRVFNWGQKVDAYYIAITGSVLALVFAVVGGQLGSPDGIERQELFTGMLVYDGFTVYMRCVLLTFVVLFALLTRLSGVPDREDGPDFFSLVLGATLGMCLMVSANHLLIIFLAVEMASVPSYVLAGMLQGRRRSSEAALKYSVYGAGAAGVMLYGISLLAGVLNSAHLPTLAARLAQMLPDMLQGGQGADQLSILALGGLMVMVGLAFKLSAVPFHFWCPDVFEGASAEVAAFLSVASKAAALALLVRVAIGFGVVSSAMSEQPVAAIAPLAGEKADGLFSVDDASTPIATVAAVTTSQASDVAALAPAREFMAKLVFVIAAVTCTFGNLAAYGQTNIKRLMAYSTIAHAGYMMMAVPAALAMAGINDTAAEKAIAALALYIGIYLFMNLGGFAVIAFLRNVIQSEEIADYAGLVRRCPGVVIAMAIILFSLIGLPPLAGFIGKFAIFAALADGYTITAAAGHPASYLMWLLVIGGLNTAISLFYYLRVVKVMIIDPEPEGRAPISFPMFSREGLYVSMTLIPIVFLIFSWDGLNNLALAAARHLFS